MREISLILIQTLVQACTLTMGWLWKQEGLEESGETAVGCETQNARRPAHLLPSESKDRGPGLVLQGHPATTGLSNKPRNPLRIPPLGLANAAASTEGILPSLYLPNLHPSWGIFDSTPLESSLSSATWRGGLASAPTLSLLLHLHLSLCYNWWTSLMPSLNRSLMRSDLHLSPAGRDS